MAGHGTPTPESGKPLAERAVSPMLRDDPGWKHYADWAERHLVASFPAEQRHALRTGLIYGYEAVVIDRRRAPEAPQVAPAPGRNSLPRGETGLNLGPRVITKQQRIDALEALGLNPGLVQSLAMSGDSREIVVRQFLAQTPATKEAINPPAFGSIMVERVYPFDAESKLEAEARQDAALAADSTSDEDA